MKSDKLVAEKITMKIHTVPLCITLRIVAAEVGEMYLNRSGEAIDTGGYPCLPFQLGGGRLLH